MPLLPFLLHASLVVLPRIQEDGAAQAPAPPAEFERSSPDGSLRVRVSERIIGFNDPAMNQESFVSSPDGHRLAYVVLVGAGLAVSVDGERGENFEGIALQSLVFSPDGEHFAYVGTRPGKQCVVFDGKIHEYDGVSRQGVVFSPDGKRSGWVAERNQNQLAVIDGQEGPPYQGIAPSGVTFSPDGRHSAYVAFSSQKQVVVVDGEEGPLFDSVAGVRFSPGGETVTYTARRDGHWFVVVGETELGPYDGVSSTIPGGEEPGTVFAANGSRIGFLAVRGEEHFAVVDGKPSAAYRGCSKLTFSPDGSRVAFLATAGEGWFLVLDGEEHRGAAYQGLFFSPDGKRCAVVLRRGDREFVSIDGTESPEHLQIESVVFSPDGSRVAYVASDGVDRTVVVDGKESARLKRFGKVPLFFVPGTQRAVWSYRKGRGEILVIDGVESSEVQNIRSLTFSEDGRHYAYAAERRPGSWTAVIDGDEYGPDGKISSRDDPTWAMVGKQTPVLSPNGERWAYSGLRDGRFVVVCDGRKSAEFDLVMKGTVGFTSDGQHLVFIAGRGSGEDGQRCIVVDDLELENDWNGFLKDTPLRHHSPSRFCMRAFRDPRSLLLELEILD